MPIGSAPLRPLRILRSEEHTFELQTHSEISYAVFCLKKKKREKDKKRNKYRSEQKEERRRDLGYVHSSRCLRLESSCRWIGYFVFFFFNDTATTEIYTDLNTLSLHDALPIYSSHIQKSRMPSSACDWS